MTYCRLRDLFAVTLVFQLVVNLWALPSGRKAGAKCSFSNPDVSFVWDAIGNGTTSGEFFKVEGLDEAAYVIKDTFPAQYYELPQAFVDKRYKWDEGFRPYANFPEFKPNYQTLYHQNSSLKRAFLDELLNISITRQPRRMAVFEDVYTNNYGLIVRPSTCEYMRNGGCTYMKHNRIYMMNGNPHTAKVVVSLTAGAFGTWHFPMECFVALAALPKHYFEEALFHVPTKSGYVASWLHLLGVSDDRIADSPLVRAEKLLVPQMARCCEMYETQIEWLRQEVAHLPKDHVSTEREVLLIKRSGSRTVDNANAVEDTVKSFAQEYKYRLTLHEDRHLPTLKEQIERFAKPTIVIAPHGAGLLFTAFSPQNVCIIEFMPEINPECYARIAYIRRLKYVMYMMDGRRIRISDVQEGLKKCDELNK